MARRPQSGRRNVTTIAVATRSPVPGCRQVALHQPAEASQRHDQTPNWVVGIVSNQTTITHLVAAVLLLRNDEWASRAPNASSRNASRPSRTLPSSAHPSRQTVQPWLGPRIICPMAAGRRSVRRPLPARIETTLDNCVLKRVQVDGISGQSRRFRSRGTGGMAFRVWGHPEGWGWQPRRLLWRSRPRRPL